MLGRRGMVMALKPGLAVLPTRVAWKQVLAGTFLLEVASANAEFVAARPTVTNLTTDLVTVTAAGSRGTSLGMNGWTRP